MNEPPGRVAIVTGAGRKRGIGREIARELRRVASELDVRSGVAL